MEKVYRTVIIDDEESAIDNLCFELQRYSYISVEGKAKTGTLGLKIIERVRPDLVFLDVKKKYYCRTALCIRYCFHSNTSVVYYQFTLSYYGSR